MSFKRIPLDEFIQAFSSTTELSSVALGGRVLSVSDEFFAGAFHLIIVEPAPSLKGQFGPKGALYSGWESRRHNPSFDWCIVQLGTPGSILGFDIDTSHFNGNEAPQVSVEVLNVSEFRDVEPRVDDPRWSEILPRVDIGPNSRHLFKVPVSSTVTHVKLKMYPDGGIARFRVYGDVTPSHPVDPHAIFDLAHVFAGGQVVFTSDQHFGVGSNLILPGRGKDMGDGWETKRSRQEGHKDWVIIKLGAPGFLEHGEIDTAHFMGNFPENCELHALTSSSTIPSEDQEWTAILPRTKLGPHRRHFFQFENIHGVQYTHVKMTIYPDGGVKRIRIFGRRSEGKELEGKTDNIAGSRPSGPTEGANGTSSVQLGSKIIPALPLTPEAFIPFGQVVQAYADENAAPRGTRITPANQGTARKYHKLAPITSSYSKEVRATPGLSVYRCKPIEIDTNGEWQVKTLERHPYTNQAFIPMEGEEQTIEGSNGLDSPGNTYLVVVAKTGEDGRPDIGTLRAFLASAAQGVVYNTAVWHQPMTVLNKSMDFTCVETQIGNGDKADCEILELEDKDGVVKVKIA